MTSRYSIKSINERRSIAEAVVVPMLTGMRDRKVLGTYGRLNPIVQTIKKGKVIYNPFKDGRIRTVLSPDTASFRLSSGSSLLYPSTNLQNQEKKVAKIDPLYRVRDVFVPKEGMILLAVDYKNAEAIGVGAYSEDWDYVDKILAGADTHGELACFMFGVTEFTPLQRDIAKTITYASFYSATVPVITANLNKEADTTGMYFSIDEVDVLHKKLLLMHPLEVWWAKTLRELDKQGGVLRNCFGYRRPFRDPDERSRLKDGLSFYPQSTVACLMNMTLPIVYETVDLEDSRELLLQVHDELKFQCAPDEIPSIVHHVTPLLERPFKINGKELYIPVEWKTGPDWGHMKAYTLEGVTDVRHSRSRLG